MGQSDHEQGLDVRSAKRALHWVPLCGIWPGAEAVIGKDDVRRKLGGLQEMSVSSIQERLARWSSFLDSKAAPGFMFFVSFPLPEEEARLPPAVPLWPDKVSARIE